MFLSSIWVKFTAIKLITSKSWGSAGLNERAERWRLDRLWPGQLNRGNKPSDRLVLPISDNASPFVSSYTGRKLWFVQVKVVSNNSEVDWILFLLRILINSSIRYVIYTKELYSRSKCFLSWFLLFMLQNLLPSPLFKYRLRNPPSQLLNDPTSSTSVFPFLSLQKSS